LIFTPVENFYLRAGKFRHEYGLNTADHIISIKRGLGWNENTETYNAELSWLGESFNFFITGIFGRPDDTNLDREKGIAVTASYFFLERYKMGLSYLNSTTNNFTRQVMGPFLSFAFTKNCKMLF
jgi:hypothetical protein